MPDSGSTKVLVAAATTKGTRRVTLARHACINEWKMNHSSWKCTIIKSVCCTMLAPDAGNARTCESRGAGATATAGRIDAEHLR